MSPSAAAAFDRLGASPRPRILFVSHAYGGGVRRHIDELAGAIARDAEVLLLAPRAGHVELRSLGDGAAIWLDPRAEWKRLVELLRAIGIDRVHFHHVHGLPREVLDLARDLDCRHDVTLHDHFPICPQYHLLDGRARFCGGEPDCRRCHELQPPQWPVSIDEWRAMFRMLLAGAHRVIAPSRDMAERVRSHFPDCDPVVWPHPRLARETPPRALRVLVPGAISPAKGLGLLVECARDAATRKLPLHFHVVGYIAYPVAVWPEVPLTIGGEYRDGELPALLAAAGGDAIFFPAQVPESYSFTLSDAMDTGLPILATDLGALPERLAGIGNAHLVRWDAPAGEVNDALMRLRTNPGPGAGRASAAASFDDYRRRYMEGLRKASRPPSRIAIEEAWLEPPPESDPPTTTLPWLFDDAFLCGRALSRDKLRERLRRIGDER